MKKRPETNSHHIIWKALANEYNVEMPENRIRLNTLRHDALHTVFGVLLTPREPLLEMRYVFDSILSTTAKQLFWELLGMKDKDFYIDGIVKNGKRERGWYSQEE